MGGKACPVFRLLAYLRSIGGAVFFFGGVVPLTEFILSRGRRLVREVEVEKGEWSAYDKD